MLVGWQSLAQYEQAAWEVSVPYRVSQDGATWMNFAAVAHWPFMIALAGGVHC
jgi:hypothetical protein